MDSSFQGVIDTESSSELVDNDADEDMLATGNDTTRETKDAAGDGISGDIYIQQEVGDLEALGNAMPDDDQPLLSRDKTYPDIMTLSPIKTRYTQRQRQPPSWMRIGQYQV